MKFCIKSLVVLHSQINRRSLGPIETSNSYTNQALYCMHKMTGDVLGPIKTSYSDANNVAVLNATIRTGEDWGPIETSISGANHSVLHAQTDR